METNCEVARSHLNQLRHRDSAMMRHCAKLGNRKMAYPPTSRPVLITTRL